MEYEQCKLEQLHKGSLKANKCNRTVCPTYQNGSHLLSILRYTPNYK